MGKESAGFDSGSLETPGLFAGSDAPDPVPGELEPDFVPILSDAFGVNGKRGVWGEGSKRGKLASDAEPVLGLPDALPPAWADSAGPS